MPLNTSPVFVGTLRNSSITTGTAANTLFDGTGTVATVVTAGTNGSKIETVNLNHIGSNVATVVRFFINNGSANSVAANNALVYEATMASNTASQTAASVGVQWQANLYLPSGYKLNVTIGTAIASGVLVNSQGGDY